MSAQFWMGIAFGSIAPWIVMIVLIRKKNVETEDQLKRANQPAELLRMRNEIGERQCAAIEDIGCQLQLLVRIEARDRVVVRKNAIAERRERIAVGALAGMDTENFSSAEWASNMADQATRISDALIDALDRKDGEA